ncbi:MAG TPA: CBS domain-containing protein [Candidatus Binataceae bacterium]|nr:CBS domain-containing protein [Candidatus Binataceae bacterium]
MKVEEIMQRDVRVCTQDDTLNAAAHIMWEYDCGCVPVIATDGNGEIVGVISDRDICMAAYTQGKCLNDISVGIAMAHSVLSCKAEDDLALVEAMMREARIHRIPVVAENGAVVGIISLTDIARAALSLGEGRFALGTQAEIARTLAAIREPRGGEEQPAKRAA